MGYFSEKAIGEWSKIRGVLLNQTYYVYVLHRVCDRNDKTRCDDALVKEINAESIMIQPFPFRASAI